MNCRTIAQSSGYIPEKSTCIKCNVENCPFCPYECKSGRWEDEAIQENDPRLKVFEFLSNEFESRYPGYSLKGFLSSFEDGTIQNDEALVRANYHAKEEDGYTFMVYLSAENIRGLLMHKISIEEASRMIKNITFKHTEFDIEGKPNVTLETIKKVFEKPGMDYPAEEARRKAEEKKFQDEEAARRAKWGIFGFIYDILHKKNYHMYL